MIFLPPLGYAETHYAPAIIPKFLRRFLVPLFKHEPEILADAPYRIEAGGRIPILIFIKDADAYPVTLEKIVFEFYGSLGKRLSTQTRVLNVLISEKIFSKIFEFADVFDESAILVDATFHYSVNGKPQTCITDNYVGSSHTPLKIELGKLKSPKLLNWYFGETHSHSIYTDDYVEFGATLEATQRLAAATGLDFACITDHSYDMDDLPDDYTQNDPDLQKHKSFLAEVDLLNVQNKNFILVESLELSCGNSKNENVHLLMFGLREMCIGTGDGAETFFKNKPELNYTDVLDKAVCYAAHPFSPMPASQKIILNRGEWIKKEFEGTASPVGMEILNGDDAAYEFKQGLTIWYELLLQGRKIFICAGNDAHGNFNRYRQIATPLVAIAEHTNQIFGKFKTAVKAETLTKDNILNALRTGKSQITSGITADISVEMIDNRFGIGDDVTVNAGRLWLNVEVLSNAEFGKLSSILIRIGKIGTNEIKSISDLEPNRFHFKDILILNFEQGRYFLSLEARTDNGHFTITNPLWISVS
jgi:hypothetical protein